MKKNNVEVNDFGNYGIIIDGSACYTYETVSTEKLAQPGILPFYNNNRALIPMRIGEFDIIPNGEQNQMPEELRQLLNDNNLSPGILQKRAFMLWGQGPALYQYQFENGVRKKFWISDPEIENWLKSFNYEDFLHKKIVDFTTANGHFTKYYLNRGARIGLKPYIARLEHVGVSFARLEWPDENDNINHIIVADYAQPWRKGLKSFPVFNESDPFAFPVSMRYNNFYAFAMDNDYPRPSWISSKSWITLGSSIPILLFNFNKNSAAIKYHIKVPAVYWEYSEKELMEKAKNEGKVYTKKMLADFKTKKFQEFADTQRGVDNVGKFVTSEIVYDEESRQVFEWKVEVLDQKVKDFIDAQVNIAKQASLETTAGFGMHPALSNISFDGNLPSGSEQLYAFKLYLLTDNDIPESIVCRDINNAIAANWPDKNVKIGFYHDVVISEQQTNPTERIKNTVPGNNTAASNENFAKCEKCGTVFNYNNTPESGMGYVKCPKCGNPVTQKSLI